MGLIELLVSAAEMLAALSDMNAAMDSYKEAVDAAKSAAEDLASKWEGASKDAFVAHEEDAYTWHNQILDVAKQMIETVRKVVDLYNSTEDAVKNIVKG